MMLITAIPWEIYLSVLACIVIIKIIAGLVHRECSPN